MTEGHTAFYVRRLVVLANMLRVLLVLGIAACCTGSRVEAQQTAIPLDYFQSFKGKPENSQGLDLIGPGADQCMKFEPAGLRITLPRNHPKESPTGLATGIAAKGDFEITVSYEILAEPAPGDAGPLGTRLSLMAGWEGPGQNVVKLTRAVRKDGSKFIAFWNAASGKEKNKTKVIPAREKTGRLRLARQGAMISFYAVDGADNDFTLLHAVRFGGEDLGSVSMVATTGGPQAALDVRFTDLRIRAAPATNVAGTAGEKNPAKDAKEEKAIAAVKKWGGAVKGWPVTELRLSNTQLTDAGLEELAAFTELQRLWLDDTPVTDAGFGHLARLKQLKMLQADRTKVADAGLQHLSAMKELQEVHLEETGMTDAGLKVLGAFKDLRKLYLSDNQLTDAGLKGLAGLTQLDTLWLSRTQVTDEGLKELAHLIQLTVLGLSSTKVSDAGLRHLTPLKQLRNLNLYDAARVTDAGLKDLAGLTQLKRLDLRRTQVTEAGITELENSLPQTQIRISELVPEAGALPPEPPTPEKATKDFYHDFRGSGFSNRNLKLTGPGAAGLIKAEPEGLRITLSDKDDTVGVAAQFHVLGDFEITVGYEILQVDRPTKWVGAGLEIYLMTETPAKDALGFDRRVRPGGGAVYFSNRITTNNQGKRENDFSDEVRAMGKSGQMRITRIGRKAVLSVADGDSKRFRVLYRVNLGNENVKFLRLAANPGGSANLVDLRLHDLRVRAESLGEVIDTGPPPRGMALWLVAGLLAALLIVGGVLIWWKRRRGPQGAQANTAAPRRGASH